MKHFKYVFLVLIASVLLCSCGKEGDTMETERKSGFNAEISITPNDKRVQDVSTKCYSDAELEQISKFRGTIEELNEKYPIECIRELQYSYRITFQGESCVAVVEINKTSGGISGNVYNLTLLKENFKVVGEGDLLEKVMELDPEGSYAFLYAGRDDFPRISRHFTKDGYLISVEYDLDNKVKSIKTELL